MALGVTCPQCGKAYSLKDELAGRALSCAACGTTITVPGTAAPARPQADAAFDRDKFLINQKIRIDEKYAVADEQGRALLFIVRPALMIRNVGGLLAGVAAAIVVGVLLFPVVDRIPKGGAQDLATIVVTVACLAALFGVAIALSAKRHTTFYRDEAMRERLLEILQDRKFQPIVATYTIRAPGGEVLARLRKNYLFNLFRKRWYLETPDGRLLCVAKEDSIILSLLRRVLGPLFGLLRTNFILLREGGDQVIGEFNRKMTLLDRYVLDLSADPRRWLDRRLALALGVMLDTGERR